MKKLWTEKKKKKAPRQSAAVCCWWRGMEDPLVQSELYAELRARVMDDPGAERYLTGLDSSTSDDADESNGGGGGGGGGRAGFARLATWHACSVVLDSAQERLPGQDDLMALLRAVKERTQASADPAGEKRLGYEEFAGLRACGGGV